VILTWRSQEFHESRNQEIEKTRKLKIGKSKNQEIQESGNLKIEKSRKAAIIIRENACGRDRDIHKTSKTGFEKPRKLIKL